VHLPATFCPTCGWCLEETSAPLAGAAEFPRGRFIGREQELTTLRSQLTRVKGGRGQVVALVGEAAIGKSWLLHEFRRSIQDGQVTYLEGRCCSYGRTIPYLPLRDIVRQYCGVTKADTAEAMAARVAQRLQEGGMVPAEGVAALLHLLGVELPAGQGAVSSPAVRRLRTFASLRQMLLTGSRQQPLVLAIEDLHWIDPTSEDWLVSLLENLADAPMLLLVTYRPEYRPAWLAKPYTTQLPLPPLTPHDSLRLVRSVLPQDTLPTSLVQAILARAAGHPLFLEELARVSIEQQTVASNMVMPDTLRGVLMAHLEQLPEVPRRLLQTASVFVRAFPVRLLAAAWDGPDGVDRALLDLERRALCYEQHELPEPTYVLKHTLVQEVAYKSLMPARRQALHAAVGQTLETLSAGHCEEVYALLAYHYAHTSAAAKAVEYLTRAAEQATKSWAHVEAVELLQQALEHVQRLPAAERQRRRLDLVLRQAHSLLALGRCRDIETLLRQQQTCLTQLQDACLTGRYALLLSQTAQHLGEWESAAQYAHHAVEAATACQDAATVGQALHVLAMERYWVGQPLEGIAYSQRAIAMLEQCPERIRMGLAYFVLGLNCLLFGDCDRALEAEAQADAIGQELGDPYLQSFAAWATGWGQAMRGEWEASRAACQRGLELAPDPLSTALALGCLGHTYLEQGIPGEAVPCLEQAIETMRQCQYQRLESLYTTFLSEAHYLHGDLDQAQALACQGLAMAEAAQYRVGIGWAQRALGKIARARGTLAEAAQLLGQALTGFTALPAHFEAARTHLLLAELARQQESRKVARQHLTAAYRLFTALGVPMSTQHTA
jgi:predicted ATPase